METTRQADEERQRRSGRRPAGAEATPRDRPGAAAPRHRRDRRLPERRQVDARQPADRDAPGRRPRDLRRHARPQGARRRVERQAALPADRHGRRRHRRRTPITRSIADQAREAVAEADLVLFVVDAQIGITPGDEEVAQILREAHKPVLVIANKIDDPRKEPLALELHRLGLGDPIPISGLHGHGTGDLLDEIVDYLEAHGAQEREELPDEAIRVAILGRPNVGKSTLVNKLLGRERVIVSEIPGTTRDSIDTVLERGGRTFVLVDTAGLRRKRRHRQGDRVLLRAARARGGGARGRRARPHRRVRGRRRSGSRRGRRRAQGRLLDADRALEVGRHDRAHRGRARAAAPPPAPASGVPRDLGEDRPRPRPPARHGRRPLRPPRRPHPDAGAEHLPPGAAQPPPAAGAQTASASTCSTARRSARGRRASASSSTTRRSSRATTATGSRTSSASASASRASPSRSTSSSAREIPRRRRRLVGHRVHAGAARPRTRRRARLPHARAGAGDRRDGTQPALHGEGRPTRRRDRSRSTTRRATSTRSSSPCRARRSRRSSPALPGRRAGAQPHERPRPGDGRAALDDRARPRRRCSLRPHIAGRSPSACRRPR